MARLRGMCSMIFSLPHFAIFNKVFNVVRGSQRCCKKTNYDHLSWESSVVIKVVDARGSHRLRTKALDRGSHRC